MVYRWSFFCEKKGLAYDTMFYWVEKCRERAAKEVVDPEVLRQKDETIKWLVEEHHDIQLTNRAMLLVLEDMIFLLM